MSVLWQQRTHGVMRQRDWTNQALARLFLVVIVITTLLAAVYLAVIASNVRLSRQIWDMEEQLGAQERENQSLMVGIARLSSIPVLQQRSIALGYIPAATVDYLRI
ncbi:MAG: hypothetical protein JXB35_08955, partial [Anaerolineae bacterium]|nr:hypothetical protein [Anaerolineae bacterium]